MSMKNAGAVLVVVGFVTWFGGSLIPPLIPFNMVGIPLIVVGAVLYFAGRKRADRSSERGHCDDR